MREGSKLIFLVLIAILILFSFLLSEKVQIFPPEQHKVIVRLILIDVIVTDKNGNFVTDLTKEDFEVYEDGQLRPIHSVELITLKSKEALLKKLPSKKLEREIKARKRLYVVFDCINTDYITLGRAKEKIINTLSNFLKEGFEIKIIEVNYRLGIRPLNDFTSDLNILKNVILEINGSTRFFGKNFYEESRDLKRIDTEKERTKIQGILDNRRKEDMANNLLTLEELWGRNLLQKSISYLLQIIGMLRATPGRKNILLISKGFPEIEWNSFVRIFDPFNILGKNSIKRHHRIMDEIIRYANTYRISFYCIDLNEMELSERREFSSERIDLNRIRLESSVLSNAPLVRLVKNTGGMYFKGAKKFTSSEKIIKRDLSYYYEIAYIPARERKDGKFHKITVKVKRKGLKVKFREGYTDYTEEDIKERNLAAAFFAPSFYKDIKFTFTIIALPESKNSFILWGRLNLPLSQFRKMGEIPEKISFFFGIKEEMDAKIHFDRVELIMKDILKRNLPYYFVYFGTKGVRIKPGIYRICSVLTYGKERIGAFEKLIKVPELSDKESFKIINFLPGFLIKNEEGGKPFTISPKDGLLRLRKYKFIPVWEDKIKRGTILPVFVQVLTPNKSLRVKPVFYLSSSSKEKILLSTELIEKNYNRKTRCYSYIYLLQIEKFPPGVYTLTIRIADQSSKEMEEKSIKVKIGT